MPDPKKKKKLLRKKPRYKSTVVEPGGKEKRVETSEKKWVAVIIELMEQGYGSKYIKQYVFDNKQPWEKFGMPAITNFYCEANKVISNQYASNIKDVQTLHVARYNGIIKRLLDTKDIPIEDVGEEKGITWDDFYRARNKKIKAYSDALDTLFSKERCLQMHSKSFTYIVNEEVDITVNNEKEKVPEFDPSKLTNEELIELLGYINKCKQSGEEIISVIEKNIDQGKTEDADFVVVETPNVESIKHEKVEMKDKGRLISHPADKLIEALRRMNEKKLEDDNPTTGIQVIVEEKLK